MSENEVVDEAANYDPAEEVDKKIGELLGVSAEPKKSEPAPKAESTPVATPAPAPAPTPVKPEEYSAEKAADTAAKEILNSAEGKAPDDLIELPQRVVRGIRTTQQALDESFLTPEWSYGGSPGGTEEYALSPVIRGAIGQGANLYRKAREYITTGNVKESEPVDTEKEKENEKQFHTAQMRDLYINPQGQVSLSELARTNMPQYVKDEAMAIGISQQIRAAEEAAGVSMEESKASEVYDNLMAIAANKKHFTDTDTPLDVLGKSFTQLADHILNNAPLAISGKLKGVYRKAEMPKGMNFISGDKAREIQNVRESTDIDFGGISVEVDPGDTEEAVNKKLWLSLMNSNTDMFINATRNGYLDDVAMVMPFTKVGKFISPTTLLVENTLKAGAIAKLAQKSTRFAGTVKFMINHPRSMAAITQAAEGALLQEAPDEGSSVLSRGLPAVLGGIAGGVHGYDFTPRSVAKAKAAAQAIFEAGNHEAMLTGAMPLPVVKDVTEEQMKNILKDVTVANLLKNKLKEKVALNENGIQTALTLGVENPEIKNMIDLHLLETEKQTPESLRNSQAIEYAFGSRKNEIANSDLDADGRKSALAQEVHARKELHKRAFNTEELLDYAKNNTHLENPLREFVGVKSVDDVRRQALVNMQSNFLNEETDDVAKQLRSRENIQVLQGVDRMEHLGVEIGEKLTKRIVDADESVLKAHGSADKGIKAILSAGRMSEAVVDNVIAINHILETAAKSRSNFVVDTVLKKLTNIGNLPDADLKIKRAVQRTKEAVVNMYERRREVDIMREKFVQNSLEQTITSGNVGHQTRKASFEESYRPSNAVNTFLREGNEVKNVRDNIYEHHQSMLDVSSFPVEHRGRYGKILDEVSDHMAKGREIPLQTLQEYKEISKAVTGVELLETKAQLYKLIQDTEAEGKDASDLIARYGKVMEALKQTAQGYAESTNLFSRAMSTYNYERSIIKSLDVSIDNILRHGNSESLFTALAKASQAVNSFNIERFRKAAIDKLRTLAPLWEKVTEDMPITPERKLEMFKELTGGLVEKLRNIDDVKGYRPVVEAHVKNIKAALTHLPEGLLNEFDKVHMEVFGVALDKELFLSQFLVPSNGFNAWQDLKKGYLSLGRLQMGAEAKRARLQKPVLTGMWSPLMGEHEMAMQTGYAAVQGLGTFINENRKADVHLAEILNNTVSKRFRDIVNTWTPDVQLALKKLDGVVGFTGFYDGHTGPGGSHYLTGRGKVIDQMFREDNTITRGFYRSNNKEDFVKTHVEWRMEFDAGLIAKMSEEQKVKYISKINQDASSDFGYFKDFQTKDVHFWSKVLKERKWIRDIDAEVFAEHQKVLKTQNADPRFAGIRLPEKKWRNERVFNEAVRNHDLEDLSDTLYAGQDYARLFQTTEEGQIAKANRMDNTDMVMHPALMLRESARRLIKGAYLAHPRSVLDNYRILTKSMGYNAIDKYLTVLASGGKTWKDFAGVASAYHLETSLIRRMYEIAGRRGKYGMATAVALRPLADLFLNADAMVTRLSRPISVLANTVSAINLMLTQSAPSRFARLPAAVSLPLRALGGVAGFSVGGIPGAIAGASPDYVLKFLTSAARTGVSFVALTTGSKEAGTISVRNNLGRAVNETMKSIEDAAHRAVVAGRMAMLDTDPNISKAGVSSASVLRLGVDRLKDFVTEHIKEPFEMALSHVALENAANVYESAVKVLKEGDRNSRQAAASMIQESMRSAPSNAVWAHVLAIEKAVKAGTPYSAAKNFLTAAHTETVGIFGGLAAPIYINNLSPFAPGMTRFFASINQGPYKVYLNSVDSIKFAKDRMARFQNFLNGAGYKNPSMELPLPVQGLVYASTFSLLGMMGAGYLLKNGFGSSVMDRVKDDERNTEKEYWLSRLFKGHEDQLKFFGYGGMEVERLFPLETPKWKIPLASRGASELFGSSAKFMWDAAEEWKEAIAAHAADSQFDSLPYLQDKLTILREQRDDLKRQALELISPEDEGKKKLLIEQALEVDREVLKLQDYWSSFKWQMTGDAFARGNVGTSWIFKDVSPFKIAMVIAYLRRENQISDEPKGSEQIGFEFQKDASLRDKEHYYPWQDTLVEFGFKKYLQPDDTFLYNKFYQDIGDYFNLSEEDRIKYAEMAHVLDVNFRKIDTGYDILAKTGAIGKVSGGTAKEILAPRTGKISEPLSPTRGDPKSMEYMWKSKEDSIRPAKPGVRDRMHLVPKEKN